MLKGIIPGFFQRLGGIVIGNEGGGGHGNTDLGRRFGILADRLHALTVGQQHPADNATEGKEFPLERSMGTHDVAHHDEALGFIKGHPVGHVFAERFHHYLNIVAVVLDDGILFPAALFIDPHRHIPVIQGAKRLDARSPQFFY